jgi:hypothetical protein
VRVSVAVCVIPYDLCRIVDARRIGAAAYCDPVEENHGPVGRRIVQRGERIGGHRKLSAYFELDCNITAITLGCDQATNAPPPKAAHTAITLWKIAGRAARPQRNGYPGHIAFADITEDGMVRLPSLKWLFPIYPLRSMGDESGERRGLDDANPRRQFAAVMSGCVRPAGTARYRRRAPARRLLPRGLREKRHRAAAAAPA